jgi:hypothetical protein
MKFSVLHPIIFFLGLLLLFTQCSEEGGGRTLPRHSGEPGEVLIIMPDGQWEGAPGDSLRAVMENFYPGLPQGEPMFTLLQFHQGQMNKMLEHHRNIIHIIIGLDAEGQNKITVSRDEWSNEQLVFTVKAENKASFYELLNTEFKKVVSMLNNKEIDRLQARLKKLDNKELEKRVKRKFNLQIMLPQGMEVAEAEEDFLWLKRERVKYTGNSAHDITQGLFIYRYPYIADSALTSKALLETRDSLLRKYVPGPKEGSYMSTEYRFPPTSKVTSLNNRYAIITRGLWKMENYFMGGPFMSMATTSANGEEIIVVSGFVFAPKFDKREYIREVEAILKSVKVRGKEREIKK